jgi:threonine/homoserine/homoserine lactone efflux protein
MVNAFEPLFSGIIFGLVAGLSPGPILTLVMAETLKFGKEEGFKVAVSPLITDSIIMILSLLALSTLAEHGVVIGLISIFGACYLVYVGLENFRIKTSKFEAVVVKKEAFKRAIITNLLNPHTYLFWISVGSPIILETLGTDASAVILFLLGFYAFLIGSMIFVALVIDRSKSLVKSKYYSYVIRVLGIVLIVFALVFLTEGLKLIASL